MSATRNPALRKMKIIMLIQHEPKKLAEFSAKRVKNWIYTYLFPMEPKSWPQFGQLLKSLKHDTLDEADT